MIELHEVGKRYGDTIVVDGVTLTLPRGGITALIGPNGAGKSSLLGMIGRLVPPGSGSIVVDGLDVTRTPGAELARRFSILRQDNSTSARLTVRDLVSFGRFPFSRGRPTPEDAAHVARALGLLDLEPLAERFLDELSGGQRQRAFIAMVLCQDTDYVLLDEPLNNLDMKHARITMKLLKSLAESSGKAVILVLHDVNFAACHADLIVAMREGRIVHSGPPAAIMTMDVMREVFDMEMDIRLVGDRRIAFYFD